MVAKPKKESKKTAKLVKHSVKNGKTLYTIAKIHKTTTEEVRKANGLKKGDNLKIGRVVKVPKSTYNVSKTKIAKAKTIKKKSNKLVKHSIKNGETLFTIARKHHTTIEEVRKANGLKKDDNLKIGRVLKVPMNTYNVPKVKIVKATKKKKVKVAKVKRKTSNKKLVASLSKLETVSLTKKKTKKADKFVVSDIFFSGKKSNLDKCKKITADAKKKLGKRYVWGASGTKNTYDCSSFTKYVYRKNGISIPRTSISQSKHGKYVERADLKKGDLIFFDTSKRRKGYVNHVGIYLGNNKFIHASSAKKKVVVSSLSRFYGKRYKGARRPS